MRKITKKNKEIYNIKMNEELNERQRIISFKQKQQRMAGDSERRMKMHREIKKAVVEGKSKEEILELLLNSEEYKEFSDYFESFIDDKIKNYEKEKEGKAPKRFEFII